MTARATPPRRLAGDRAAIVARITEKMSELSKPELAMVVACFAALLDKAGMSAAESAEFGALRKARRWRDVTLWLIRHDYLDLSCAELGPRANAVTRRARATQA